MAYIRGWVLYSRGAYIQKGLCVSEYRISSIKRRGALKIFKVLGAALFRGRRLLEGSAFEIF